ncbi:hypothetical protein [Cupriavidus metallidurans]|nr:hypothetical protein [Cupriavidus metallidurans]
MKLRVTVPFGAYQIGDEITDADAIKAILGSEQAAYVVQVKADPPPKSK